MATAAAYSMDPLKAAMRSMWMAGDFGVIARSISRGSDAFARSLHVPLGTRVLDVACGTGNVAIPLACNGAVVTGLDIAPNLLEQARQRAREEGLCARFDEGDAEEMPYPNDTFDVVVSMFGAMFAPHPEAVAAEMARVLRPGGQLAMANWTPGSFSGKLFKVSSKHVPPPAGVVPPVLWGDPDSVRQRLDPFFEEIVTERVAVDCDLATDPAGAVELFRTYFGPTLVAFSKLDPAGQQAMRSDLEALWSSANVSPEPGHTQVKNEYLKVTARKRGRPVAQA